MVINVHHGDEFIEKVRICAKVNKRSISKQIEHWAKIGRMVEDNPDLPYSFIKDVIIATAERDAKKVTKYVRGTRD